MLEEKIASHDARIAVIGLGYVGLTLSVELGKVGFSVTGIDTSARKVDLVESGKSDVQGVSEFEVVSLKTVGKLTATGQNGNCILTTQSNVTSLVISLSYDLWFKYRKLFYLLRSNPKRKEVI